MSAQSAAHTPTARDILLDVIRFHGDLATHYQSLTDAVDGRDSRLLLQYLQRHERLLQNSVRRCGTELREDILAIPLTTKSILPSARELPLLPTPEVDAVVALGRQMDHTLISYYDQLVCSAPNESIRRLFRSLLLEETQEEDRLRTASLCLQTV